jgi:two-component system, OmpR family, response regulator QseB
MMRLLLVEDDTDLGAALLRALREEGYDVIWVRRLQEARAQLDRSAFACLVLDINLPDGEGFLLLTSIRSQKMPLAVIVMTAREALDDRLRAFTAGADDYVIKPFAVPELSARIAAVTRRAAGFAENTWTLGEIEYSPSQRAVKVDGIAIALTPMELSLLEQLIRAAERVVTRRVLLENVWAVNDAPSDAALEVLVHGLRKKLGATQIKTVRGVGYMLTAL